MQRAVASTALKPLLTGPATEGRLLGASSRASWIGVADEVLVVGLSGSAQLPNGVTVGSADTRLLDGAVSGDPVAVGNSLIVLPGLRAGVVRWWEPRPLLPACGATDVRERTGQVRRHTHIMPDLGLGAALAAGDGLGVLEIACRLVGRGPGLTPDGDDLLAATVASYRLMGSALGVTVAPGRVDAVFAELAELAADRTTALAASLLRHACAGNVAAPVAGLLLALSGRGRVPTAVDGLLGVGHTSGLALLSGVVAGVEAACQEASG